MTFPFPITVGGSAGITTDPSFANVQLLVGFNGDDAATSAVDEGPDARTLTFVNQAQLDTAQKKFGTASLLCDGTTDRVTVPDSADWVFSGQYTVEAHVRFNALSASRQLIVGQYGANGARAWGFRISNDSSTGIMWWASSDGVNNNRGVSGSATGVTTGVWYHLAADRDASDVVRIYLDGVMKGSGTFSGSLANVANALSIGASTNDASAESTDGWIDEVRVTTGVARYANDGGFSPPTKAYPRS